MRYKALDGWRGLCAVLVALHHFHVDSHLFHLPPIRNGYLLVDFFFVLSGFVISHSWGGRIPAAPHFCQFMARRFARVWPLHVAVLALFVLMEAAKAVALAHTGLTVDHPPFTGDTGVAALLSNMALLHALGLHDRATWNYPSWSISTEFYTYALFGLLVLAGLARRLFYLMLAAAAGAAMVALFSREWLHTITDFGFFRCVYGFFLGCAVHRLVACHGACLPKGSAAELVAVAAIIAVLSASPKGAPLSMAAPLVFGAAVAVFAAEAGLVSRMLRAPLSQALGAWSYSIYLLHSLVLVMIGRAVNLVQRLHGLALTEAIPVNGDLRPLLVLGGPWAGDAAMLAYVLVVVGVSSLGWRWVELPGQRLLKPLANGARWAWVSRPRTE